MDKRILGFGAAALLLVGVPVIAPVIAAVQPFAAAVASADRPEADKTRDADRKPGELIAFAGLRPGWKVLEVSPGGGYFTRVLSLATGPTGYVYANGARPAPAVAAWAQSHGNVSYQQIEPGKLTAPEPVDLVWTTQNYHDFKNTKVGDSDVAAVTNAAAFAALKPGGIYLISDHQAAPGAGATVTSTLHRIEDKTVISEVEAAGFKLEARSDMLKHPADDHTLKVVETGIRGKTDQFVLRFRKPRVKR